jgi:molecular chaperone DnaK (HSP70)
MVFHQHQEEFLKLKFLLILMQMVSSKFLHKGTGKSHDIRIEASSGLTSEEIEMKQDAEANAESDKVARSKS